MPRLDEKLLERARSQPEPLKKGGKDSDMYRDISDALATLWRVADEHNLNKEVQFTNFVMFGPQSAGKTTLTERILGFPVARVKTGVATTRPMVLTTRRDAKEEVRVKDETDDSIYQPIAKEKVMDWALQKMSATGKRITDKRIYIEASGPEYMNRRFIDLPGFQLNEEGSQGTREAILTLLRTSMKELNAVVICVEDATLDYANSTLIKAMEEVFGSDFAKDPAQFQRRVIALNKSDMLSSKEQLEDKLAAYFHGCGLVPFVVGFSIGNRELQVARSRGSAKFSDIMDDYKGANLREEKFYSGMAGIDNSIRNKFLGFENLLGTVDAMVLRKDVHHVKQMASQLILQLQNRRDLLQQEIQKLIDKRNVNVETAAPACVTQLVENLIGIATSDSGTASQHAVRNVDDIRKYGKTSRQEELEFAFGLSSKDQDPTIKEHQDVDTLLKGYYNRKFDYAQSGRSSKVEGSPNNRDAKLWIKQISATVNKLKSSNIESISYLNTPLMGGQMYERAIAVWASSVYTFLAPSEDDLLRLANILGTDPELSDPYKGDFKKAKRLAEVYIVRLVPALHYLCQKMEYLLLVNFDTAWRVLLRSAEQRNVVEAVSGGDGDAFEQEVRACFRNAIRKRAAIAYDRCFSDLENELLKLMPYQSDSAPVTGMMFAFPDSDAFPDDSVTTAAAKETCNNYLKTLFPDGDPAPIVQGVEQGLALISEGGSIGTIIFAGLQIVKPFLLDAYTRGQQKYNNGDRRSSKDDVRRSGKKNLRSNMASSRMSESFRGSFADANSPLPPVGGLAEARNLRLLGFSAVLYVHFLPRFISTIDGRMRGHLWSNLKSLEREIREEVSKSSLIKAAMKKNLELDKKIKILEEKEQRIADSLLELPQLAEKVSEYTALIPLPVEVANGGHHENLISDDDDNGSYSDNQEGEEEYLSENFKGATYDDNEEPDDTEEEKADGDDHSKSSDGSVW